MRVSSARNRKYAKTNKSVVFRPGFADKLDNDFDELNRTFYGRFDWNSIKNNCEKFFVFHSDNDPYVPLEKARTLAKSLDAHFILIKNAGHFNEAAGYMRFDKLLETIKREIHKSDIAMY